MSSVEKGVCVECGKLRRLTKGGVVWHHSVPKSFPPARCPGSGRPPGEGF